jgi:hypothetical protein
MQTITGSAAELVLATRFEAAAVVPTMLTQLALIR